SSALQSAVNLASRASTVVNVGNLTQAAAPPQRPAPTMHLYVGQMFNVIVGEDLPLSRYEQHE
ncbi:MAG: hypothetical protein ACREM8_02825, partial [Vulcanimicrobiaceae bacterium]